MENQSVSIFTNFLTDTLIPDLKSSGDLNIARDLEHAVKFINGQNRVAGKSRKDFLSYLEMVENDLRKSGRDATAQDYFTARMMIYWDM